MRRKPIHAAVHLVYRIKPQEKSTLKAYTSTKTGDPAIPQTIFILQRWTSFKKILHPDLATDDF